VDCFRGLDSANGGSTKGGQADIPKADAMPNYKKGSTKDKPFWIPQKRRTIRWVHFNLDIYDFNEN